MDLVVLILAILYLCGCKVGIGLAICAIIEMVWLVIKKLWEEWE